MNPRPTSGRVGAYTDPETTGIAVHEAERTVRAVAIVFNILALLGLAVLLLLDSSDDGPWLLPVVVCALISALAALLWPGSRR